MNTPTTLHSPSMRERERDRQAGRQTIERKRENSWLEKNQRRVFLVTKRLAKEPKTTFVPAVATCRGRYTFESSTLFAAYSHPSGPLDPMRSFSPHIPHSLALILHDLT